MVTGASGQIGKALVEEAEHEGHRVTRLVRREPRDSREQRWDPASRSLDHRVLDGADAVVNLAGARLSKLPWTYNVKKEILRSRVNATLTITQAIARAARPPRVLLNASAVGVYGDRPGETLTETSTASQEGFLPRVVDRWERAAATAPAGTRVVLLRTGLVIGRGGFLSVLRALGQVGLLSKLGEGSQHWPWIGLKDEVRAILFLLERGDISGPVNLVGPTPATANEIIEHLAAELRRPVVLKAPGAVIDFTLREAGRELVLSDQLAQPKVLLDHGFVFRDETVAEAVDRSHRLPAEPNGDEA